MDGVSHVNHLDTSDMGLPPDNLPFEDPVFRELMAFRVRELLLVSSPYDSYALEEDAQLGEFLDVEYLQLHLSSAPHITRVSTGEEALAALAARHYDLVVTMTRLGEMDVRDFGRTIKDRYPDLPVILLAASSAEAARLKETSIKSWIDQVFIWRGDVKIFLAIIKYVEDLLNIDRDVAIADVRAIVLIENSVRFYSSYLPVLYSELMHQNQRVMADGVNAMQKIRRMRARPKILLAETFEDGLRLFTTYRRNVLGVISDARFPRQGQIDPEAGLEFVRRVKASDPDMPALIQSSDEGLAEPAAELGAAFLNKRSPTLLEDLRHFIQTSLGFGDFVFLLPDGSEVGRAADLAAMPRVLKHVPEASLRYHATRNHFSNWCMARTEFALAARLRPVKVSEFTSIEDLRKYLIDAFSQLRTDTHRGVVADFSLTEFGETSGFARIGAGSLGGKGRGLGFLNALLSQHELPADLRGVRVHVPPAAVIGTQVFDDFLADNELAEEAMTAGSDAEVIAGFLKGRFRAPIAADLRAFVDRVRDPIAVRSSSLLEDSYDQPFAGIYCTTMLREQRPGPGGPLQRVGTGGQARLRLELLPERQGLPPEHAESDGGAEDGGGAAEARGPAARLAFLSRLRRGRLLHELLPSARYASGGWRGTRRARPRQDRSRRRAGGALEPRPAAQLAAVRHSGDDARERPTAVLCARPGSAARCRFPRRRSRFGDRPPRSRASRGGWDPGARRIDLLTRQRRGPRRHFAGGDPARDFGAAPQARIVSARALALAPARDRESRPELPGGDRVRSERESGARRPARVRAAPDPSHGHRDRPRGPGRDSRPHHCARTS